MMFSRPTGMALVRHRTDPKATLALGQQGPDGAWFIPHEALEQAQAHGFDLVSDEETLAKVKPAGEEQDERVADLEKQVRDLRRENADLRRRAEGAEGAMASNAGLHDEIEKAKDPRIAGDGIHDDTAGIQAAIDAGARRDRSVGEGSSVSAPARADASPAPGSTERRADTLGTDRGSPTDRGGKPEDLKTPAPPKPRG